MKKLLALTFFALLLSSSLAKADIYQYDVNAEIFNNNTAHYTLSFIFSSNASQKIIIPLGMPANVQINSSIACSEQKGSIETTVSCTEEPNSTLTIDYDASTIKAQSNYFLFEDSFKIVEDTKTLSVLIKLPEGSGLLEPIDKSYTPENALISSDGRRPILNWVSDNMKAGDRFDVSIAFERIFQTSQLPLVGALFVAVVIFLGLGIFYRFYWKARRMNIIIPVLKKDEKMIFNIITKHGDGVNQKIIVKDSGYSKAKVSKVLTSLKERGLVKLERIGRSNKVHIDKNFEKKTQK